MQPILWEFPDLHSVEYFILTAQDGRYVLEGTVILLLSGLPTKIVYRVECDDLWKTRVVDIHQDRVGEVKHLKLSVSDDQIWRSGDRIIPFAAGIFDVDIQVTPATNSLPIRRLALKVGESQAVDALWIVFPDLIPQRLQQIYTRISDRVYHYENPSTGFRAELEVDEFGLVVTYGDFWRRITT
jgi:hypothetical protein